MKRQSVRARGWMLVMAVLALAAGGRASAQSAGALTEFERQLAVAANAGDIRTLASLSAAGDESRFRWVTHRGLIGSGGAWTVATVSDPASEPDPAYRWVAFSRYQVCESDHDRLFRLVNGPEGLRLGDEAPETETGGYRVRHHDLSVRFDVPARRVQIADRATIERRADAWPVMVLRLNAPYSVTGLRADGRPAPHQRAGGFLAVRAPLQDRFVLELTYEAPMEGRNEDYILPDHAALTSYWYPHTGRLPATSRVAVTAPARWSAISIGNLVGREVRGDEATTTFQNDLAVCYLTVTAGDYHVTTRTIGAVPVSAYLLRDDAARASSVVTVAGKALDWFSRHFSPYPYKAYAVVESKSFPAALECYSFTLCGSSTIPGAVPHEVSHTWWGGIVPNTYTRSMWNEAFATYSEDLYRRLTSGSSPRSPETAATTQAMLSAASGVSLLNAQDAMDFQQAAVGYAKGGAVLRELERMLGTERMLAAMRRFVARHTAGEPAEWQDFADAVADVAGTEWRGFFNSWLSRTDLPDLRLEGVRATSESGHYVVSGSIGFNGTAYWLAVPIAVSTQAGEVKSVVSVKGVATPFRVETAGRPTRLRVDPGNEVLRLRQPAAAKPTLAQFQTSSAPLLIVYATGGSARSAEVAREAASSAKALFPFAAISVKADTAVSGNDFGAANVLLIGRSEDLRVPKEWTDASPIRSEDGVIQIGKEAFRGTGYWALAIMPHPSRPDGFVAHAAGAGPESLRGFARQGDLDAHMSLFVVGADGRPVLQKRAEAAGGLTADLTIDR